ncbi:hypothetical protein J437_LFUL003775 [Ladona fulva]|uniref:Xenotropic and polytropic retrovirus receptor 1 n=1 Tax=Ladona fulva TaxID=123851 RepID=A0A8K0JUF0_LADFU|nr:hypothetical protein J437_LFUL003775 [Ladona fulva]
MKFEEYILENINPCWKEQYIQYWDLKILLMDFVKEKSSIRTSSETVSHYYNQFHEIFFYLCENELKKINLFYSENITSAHFHTNEETKQIIHDMEDRISRSFEERDLQKTIKRLRSHPAPDIHQVKTIFKVGLYNGCLIILLVATVISAMFYSGGEDWHIVLRIFRGPLVLIELVFFAGLNIHIWQKARINHIRIFDLDPKDHLNKYDVYEIAALLAIVWTSSVLGFLYSSLLKIPPYAFPLAMVVVVLIILLNPLPFFWYKARVGMLKIMNVKQHNGKAEKLSEANRRYGDLMMKLDLLIKDDFKIKLNDQLQSNWKKNAEKIPPDKQLRRENISELRLKFYDFYLELISLQNYQILNFEGFQQILKKYDQACSFIIYSISMLVEIFSNESRLLSNPFSMDFLLVTKNRSLDVLQYAGDTSQCLEKSYIERSIAASIPATIRFLQCLRLYRDTKLPFPHIANAGKYATVLFVFTFLALFKITEGQYSSDLENPYFITWVFFSILNAVWAFLWDVMVDWGLFSKFKGKNIFLKDEMIFPHKSYYYLAIIEDFILRYNWLLLYLMTKYGFASLDTMFLILSPLEVFRRFLWNILRLENEHIRNRDKYQSVRCLSLSSYEEPKEEADFRMSEETPSNCRRRKSAKRDDPSRKSNEKTYPSTKIEYLRSFVYVPPSTFHQALWQGITLKGEARKYVGLRYHEATNRIGCLLKQVPRFFSNLSIIALVKLFACVLRSCSKWRAMDHKYYVGRVKVEMGFAIIRFPASAS